MDYPFPVDNWFCRRFGHRWSYAYTDRSGTRRTTCKLDGHTVPPFRKVKQYSVALGEDPYLPDDEQPPGAI